MKYATIIPTLLALAVPVLAAGLPPPAASTHPAASAHAARIAGQADATRIEACSHAADSLIDHLDHGDYTAATSNFDATMRAALDADKLREVWQSVGAQYGKLNDRAMSQNMIYENMAVITIPLHFDHGNLAVQVACDNNGRFAGFHVLPVSGAPASAGSSGQP